MNTRCSRPGSYGAFLLAVHQKASEESIKTEIVRAKEAGTETNATEAVLKQLSARKFWVRDSTGVVLTQKGLNYLRSHKLI